MKVEARLFEILTVFFIVVTIGYGIITARSRTGLEWAGFAALALSAGLTIIVGTYLRFVARRIDTLPEDYDDAEIADGAGEVGAFAAHSLWPILTALSASLAAVAFAFFQWWMIIPAAAFIVICGAGMTFEYYIGPERH